MLLGFVHAGEGVVHEAVGEGLLGGELLPLGFEGLHYAGALGGGELAGDVSGGATDQQTQWADVFAETLPVEVFDDANNGVLIEVFGIGLAGDIVGGLIEALTDGVVPAENGSSRFVEDDAGAIGGETAVEVAAVSHFQTEGFQVVEIDAPLTHIDGVVLAEFTAGDKGIVAARGGDREVRANRYGFNTRLFLDFFSIYLHFVS